MTISSNVVEVRRMASTIAPPLTSRIKLRNRCGDGRHGRTFGARVGASASGRADNSDSTLTAMLLLKEGGPVRQHLCRCEVLSRGTHPRGQRLRHDRISPLAGRVGLVRVVGGALFPAQRLRLPEQRVGKGRTTKREGRVRGPD